MHEHQVDAILRISIFASLVFAALPIVFTAYLWAAHRARPSSGEDFSFVCFWLAPLYSALPLVSALGYWLALRGASGALILTLLNVLPVIYGARLKAGPLHILLLPFTMNLLAGLLLILSTLARG